MARRRLELPGSAQCVIIGGGVGGTSVAYHLAELGMTDVVLVDRNQLTSGSTFHSAGLVGQLRGSVSLTKMMMYSVELYRRLREESEFDPGWSEVGSLRLAASAERMEELRRQAGWAKTFGLPLELIGPGEARDLFPLMTTDGVLGAVLPPHRRLPRPLPAHLRAGRPRPSGRLPDLHEHARDRHRRGARPGAPGAHRARRHRDRAGGERRRHVRGRDRPHGRRPRADRADGARVPGHPADPQAARRASTSRRCATRTCSSTSARMATAS